MPESLLMPGVAAWVQLSKDETQWVLQQLQGLGEKKKIAQRIWAWPLDIPDLTVATAALTDIAVAVHHVYPTHVGCSARGCLEQRTRTAVRVQPLRGEPSRSPTVLFAYRTKSASGPPGWARRQAAPRITRT